MPYQQKSIGMPQKTITLSRDEYDFLISRAQAYDRIQTFVQKDFFAQPPIRDAKKVIEELQKTKKYSPTFLKSVSKGLQRSSYFT